jgi:hypothetical protein
MNDELIEETATLLDSFENWCNAFETDKTDENRENALISAYEVQVRLHALLDMPNSDEHKTFIIELLAVIDGRVAILNEPN